MKVHIYRTYRFIDKDPVIDAVRTIVQQEHLKNAYVHQLSGVATTTLDNWFDGATKQPRNSTVAAVSAALGYVRHDRLRSDGTVEIGFEKARDLDWDKEIEKQADWILKQKKPRSRKPRAGMKTIRSNGAAVAAASNRRKSA